MFVGWEIKHGHDRISISQRRYTAQLLRKFGLLRTNGCWTPLPKNADISSTQEHEKLLPKSKQAKYRSIVGELLYVSVCTRPDISFFVNALPHQFHAPTYCCVALLKEYYVILLGPDSWVPYTSVNYFLSHESVSHYASILRRRLCWREEQAEVDHRVCYPYQ